MRELLLGCGHDRRKKVALPNCPNEWDEVTTLDRNPLCKPDILWDLERIPWPLDACTFDEVHAYEVVEHVTGQQGEVVPFFAFFSEVWRVLKPDGLFLATVPKWDSQWAWGDPSHKRVISLGTLAFLSQREYSKQIAEGSAMSDYRNLYKADFDVAGYQYEQESMIFVLKKVEPSRCPADLSQ